MLVAPRRTVTHLTDLLTRLADLRAEVTNVRVRERTSYSGQQQTLTFPSATELLAQLNTRELRSPCWDAYWRLVGLRVSLTHAGATYFYDVREQTQGGTYTLIEGRDTAVHQQLSRQTRTTAYANLLRAELEVYAQQTLNLTVPTASELYVTSCYVRDDYVL